MCVWVVDMFGAEGQQTDGEVGSRKGIRTRRQTMFLTSTRGITTSEGEGAEGRVGGTPLCQVPDKLKLRLPARRRVRPHAPLRARQENDTLQRRARLAPQRKVRALVHARERRVRPRAPRRRPRARRAGARPAPTARGEERGRARRDGRAPVRVGRGRGRERELEQGRGWVWRGRVAEEGEGAEGAEAREDADDELVQDLLGGGE